MKVTERRIFIRSYWETFKMLPLLTKTAWYKLCTVRLTFYNEMMRGFIRNPNLRW